VRNWQNAKKAHAKELKRLKTAKIFIDSRLKIYQYTLKVALQAKKVFTEPLKEWRGEYL
jgi:hypothetical protein